MKKFLSIIFLCLMFFGLCACNEAYISYETDSITLYENEVYYIDKDKIDTNSLENYSIISLDENIAKIQDFVIYPISVGSTTIRIGITEETFFDITVTVGGGNMAKEVHVDSDVVRINMGESLTALNKITTNEDCTEVPQITYNSDIISYDYTSGVITAKSTGETQVTIKYDKCETTFTVTVYNTVYTKLLQVTDNYIFTNSEGKLKFDVFPQNSNTYRFWTSSNDITILRDGTYQTKNPTTAVVFYQYYHDYNQQSEIKSFKVSVINKISDFDIEIYNENNSIAKSFILDKTYKMLINIPSSYTQNNFMFSTNIELKSSIEMIDEYTYSLQFKFNYIGSQFVKVTMIENLGNIENKVIHEESVTVFEKSSVEIAAKWSAYMLTKYDDGKYHIYLNSETSPSYIYFILKLDDEVLNETFTVYKISNDGNKIETNRKFTPTEIGEYVFEIEYDGNILGRVSVIVDEM